MTKRGTRKVTLTIPPWAYNNTYLSRSHISVCSGTRLGAVWRQWQYRSRGKRVDFKVGHQPSYAALVMISLFFAAADKRSSDVRLIHSICQQLTALNYFRRASPLREQYIPMPRSLYSMMFLLHWTCTREYSFSFPKRGTDQVNQLGLDRE